MKKVPVDVENHLVYRIIFGGVAQLVRAHDSYS